VVIRFLNPNEGAALRAGTARFYVWGSVYYQDAFNKRQVTRFRLTVPVTAQGNMRDVEFSSEGNEAT
jgi:hypothetical protein